MTICLPFFFICLCCGFGCNLSKDEKAEIQKQRLSFTLKAEGLLGLLIGGQGYGNDTVPSWDLPATLTDLL